MVDHHVDELLQAFRSRDWAGLQELARSGADINGLDDAGLSVLMRAARNGEAKVAQAILESGADVDLRSRAPIPESSGGEAAPRLGERLPKYAKWDTLQQTALLLAAQRGHRDVVELLIDAGADPTLEDRQGDTPVQAAAQAGQAAVVAYLLASAPDERRTALADEAFEAALIGGHAEAAELAIEAGATRDLVMGAGSSMTPLYAAALRGHDELAKVLIKAGVDAMSAGAQGIPLIAALRQGHDDIVRSLAAHHRVRGHDLNVAARSLPLHIAIKEAPSAVSLRRLLPLGFDIEATDPTLSTPLQLAASQGRVDMIDALVEMKAEVDGFGKPPSGNEMHAPRDAGRTPLMLAAAAGHLEAVQRLIELGADTARRIDSQSLTASSTDPLAKVSPEVRVGGPRLADEGCNALMLAAQAGHLDVVRLLLQAAPDLETANHDGETAIVLANRNGHQEVVDALAAAGASVTALGPSNLLAAVRNGDEDKVAELLVSGVRADVTEEDPRHGTRTALHLAAEAGHHQIVGALLQAGAQPNTPVVDGNPPFDRTALHLAAANGHHEAAGVLLAHGAAVDAQTRAWDGPGETPLSMAAEAGHAAVIAVLAEAGAELTGPADSARPLTTAAGAGHGAAVRQLIQRGAPVAAGRQEALVEAANGGHLDVVNALLEAGADSNQFPPDNWSALTAAVANNHQEVASRLIAAGADPDGGQGGLGPLDQAIMNGNLELVQLLLDSGADVNRRGSGGKTPLMDAVSFHPTSGDEVSPLLPILLAKGADPNLQNDRGETALHLAIDQSKVGDANLLIEAEPNLNLADQNGRTVLSHAIERGFGDMAALLQTRGAAAGTIEGPLQGDFTPRDDEDFDNRDQPVERRRGIDLEDGDDTLILVLAPLEAATRAFQMSHRAEIWERNVVGKTVELTPRCYLSFRLVGHAWTVIRACYLDAANAQNNLTAEDAKAISESTSAPTILFLNSDNASVVGYTYFESGEEKERFFYDPEGGEWDADASWEDDDDDEAWEVEEEEEGWAGPPPVFLSIRRQIDTRQIEDPWVFVDHFLKEMDAFAPSLEIRVKRPFKELPLSFEGFEDEDFDRMDFIAVR